MVNSPSLCVLLSIVCCDQWGKWSWKNRECSFIGAATNRSWEGESSGVHIYVWYFWPLTWYPFTSHSLWEINVFFRPIIGHSRRRFCWSTTWWRLSGTLAPSSMTTPAALENTWKWSSLVEERWSEQRYPSTSWRNQESPTRQRKYHFVLISHFVFLSNVSDLRTNNIFHSNF